MNTRSKKNAVNRRDFLSKTGSGLLAAAIPAATTWVKVSEAVPDAEIAAVAEPRIPAGTKKKIPIGVFDPVYGQLSLDEMLDKVSAQGLEAMEIGTGGYPDNKHCALDDLVADKN